MRSSAIIAISWAAFAATAAPAKTGTTTLEVSADVSDSCTVSASPVNFGSVNLIGGTSPLATGDLTVRCTNGTGWSATASVGTGSGATVATRKLTHAEDASKTINYMLFTDAGRTTAWGDGTGGTAVTGTGTGAEQVKTVYAAIPTGQRGASLGDYSDALTVTLTY